MSRASLLVAGTVALGVAVAPAVADPRITVTQYQPSQIVTLHGRSGVESTVAFADDEHIENVAVGDSAAWQVIPNKRANLLFVKPITAAKRTNMTVVTDQRTYLFDLVNAPRTPPVYMLRFSYPNAPAHKPVPATPALTTAAASPPPAPAPAPAPVPTRRASTSPGRARATRRSCRRACSTTGAPPSCNGARRRRCRPS